MTKCLLYAFKEMFANRATDMPVYCETLLFESAQYQGINAAISQIMSYGSVEKGFPQRYIIVSVFIGRCYTFQIFRGH